MRDHGWRFGRPYVIHPERASYVGTIDMRCPYALLQLRKHVMPEKYLDLVIYTIYATVLVLSLLPSPPTEATLHIDQCARLDAAAAAVAALAMHCTSCYVYLVQYVADWSEAPFIWQIMNVTLFGEMVKKLSTSIINSVDINPNA